VAGRFVRFSGLVDSIVARVESTTDSTLIFTRRASYNGAQKADIVKNGSDWYFKTGTYVQSNLLSGEAADAVGQVVLYSLDVRHAS
jgi:hypothetical protein